MPSVKKQTLTPIGRYIDPLTDFGFKKIFGSEPNKDLLIAFLNEIFKGRKVIHDLVYNQQENQGPANFYRKAIFDLTCTGADGETFIIEMQKAEQKFFTDRAVYYAASRLYDQAPKGKKDWDFELKEVYFIAIMDFNFVDTSPNKYMHRVRLTEEETGYTFYNKLGFIFLELPNFNKEEKDINTEIERWLYVLRNMSRLKKIPVILNKQIFQKLFQIAEVANLKKEEYMVYEKSLLDKWTEYAVLKTAEERGLEKGMQKGMQKGVEKSKEQFVKNLLTNTEFGIAKIAALADVSEAFVKKIKKGIKK